MRDEQALMHEVADVLLDVGISLPLVRLRIPFSSRFVALRAVMRRPSLGSQIRLVRKWLELGISYEELEALSPIEEQVFFATRGKLLSELVALCILRGRLSGWLWLSPLSFLIRHCTPHDCIKGVLLHYIRLMGTQSFKTFIGYLERTSPLVPSHKTRGS